MCSEQQKLWITRELTKNNFSFILYVWTFLQKAAKTISLWRWPLIVNIYLSICFKKYKFTTEFVRCLSVKKTLLIHHLCIFQIFLVKRQLQSEPFESEMKTTVPYACQQNGPRNLHYLLYVRADVLSCHICQVMLQKLIISHQIAQGCLFVYGLNPPPYVVS